MLPIQVTPFEIKIKFTQSLLRFISQSHDNCPKRNQWSQKSYLMAYFAADMPMESGAVVVPPAAAGWVVVAIMVSNVDGALITETPQGQQRVDHSLGQFVHCNPVYPRARSCSNHTNTLSTLRPTACLPTFLSPVSRRRSWWWDDVYLSLKINRIEWENVLNWRWGGKNNKILPMRRTKVLKQWQRDVT